MLALRKRFNPDSYDALLDLTVNELRQKFRYSQQIYLNFESTIEQHFATLNQNQEEQIFSGHPILTASLGENNPAIGEHNLESDYHIKHFQVSLTKGAFTSAFPKPLPIDLLWSTLRARMSI